MKKWLSIAAVVIVLDQITKYIAEAQLTLHRPLEIMPMFNFTLAYNKGAAFSFLSEAGGWQRWFFTIIAIAVSILIVFWLTRLQAHEKRQAVALSLILGGAIGNLIDRIYLGHVIDFIEVYYDKWYWPAFNIADSAITIGVVLIIYDNVREYFKSKDSNVNTAH